MATKVLLYLTPQPFFLARQSHVCYNSAIISFIKENVPICVGSGFLQWEQMYRCWISLLAAVQWRLSVLMREGYMKQHGQTGQAAFIQLWLQRSPFFMGKISTGEEKLVQMLLSWCGFRVLRHTFLLWRAKMFGSRFGKFDCGGHRKRFSPALLLLARSLSLLERLVVWNRSNPTPLKRPPPPQFGGGAAGTAVGFSQLILARMEESSQKPFRNWTLALCRANWCWLSRSVFV